MRKHVPMRALILALLGVFGCTMFAMGEMTTSGGAQLSVGRVFVTTVGPAATSSTAPTGTDSRTSAVKTAGVHKCTITNSNGAGATVSNELDVLYRVQEREGSIYIDFVFDATITSLSNTVAAMDLVNGPSGNAQPLKIGHPSPTKDKVDTQALVSAGGS